MAVRFGIALLGILSVLFLGGCASIPIEDQAMLAKPSMQFASASNESFVTQNQSLLEPGVAGAAGLSSGCSSCR